MNGTGGTGLVATNVGWEPVREEGNQKKSQKRQAWGLVPTITTLRSLRWELLLSQMPGWAMQ